MQPYSGNDSLAPKCRGGSSGGLLGHTVCLWLGLAAFLWLHLQCTTAGVRETEKLCRSNVRATHTQNRYFLLSFISARIAPKKLKREKERPSSRTQELSLVQKTLHGSWPVRGLPAHLCGFMCRDFISYQAYCAFVHNVCKI